MRFNAPWNWLTLAVTAGAFAFMAVAPRATTAQDAAAPSVALPSVAAPSVTAALRHAIQTQVVTIKIDPHRGEPKPALGLAKFDRDIEACWVTLVGYDVKFSHSTEKQINRLHVSVDPFAKIVNGKEAEVTGTLGLRDGSGDWDDTYEGTLTVAVTAVLAPQ